MCCDEQGRDEGEGERETRIMVSFINKVIKKNK